MATNKYQKALVERRKSNGLCINCGSPLDRAGLRCKKCCEKRNKWTREHREWYLSHKICPRCGKNDLMGDETICPECRAKGTNNTLKKRNRDTYNSYHNEWAKSTYKKRKEAGVCTRCGKRKAPEGYFKCSVCRAKDNERRRIREGTSEQSERIEKGLCYFCGNPVKKGYKVCEKHYQMNIENAKKGRKTQEAQEYIRSMNRIVYGNRRKK